MVVGAMALHRHGYGGHCVSKSPATIAKATSASSVTMAKAAVEGGAMKREVGERKEARSMTRGELGVPTSGGWERSHIRQREGGGE